MRRTRRKRNSLRYRLGRGMITVSRVKLREKRLLDARNDYRWQTAPDLVRLDAAPLLTTSFQQYLLDYTDELRHPNPRRHLFAIETLDGRHIGNCVYYNVDEDKREVELGIMIGEPDCWDSGYGTEAVNCLVDHIFQQTNLKRIYLKTLDWNLRAQRCFQKCGFAPCGHLARDGHDFILMELHRRHWQKGRQND